jgi:hypothetical protein
MYLPVGLQTYRLADSIRGLLKPKLSVLNYKKALFLFDKEELNWF